MSRVAPPWIAVIAVGAMTMGIAWAQTPPGRVATEAFAMINGVRVQ